VFCESASNGNTFPVDIPARRFVGAGCCFSENRSAGLICGESFYPCWTKKLGRQEAFVCGSVDPAKKAGCLLEKSKGAALF